MYVGDCRACGQVKLKLTATNGQGVSFATKCTDEVSLYVTETKSWAPFGKTVCVWEPCWQFTQGSIENIKTGAKACGFAEGTAYKDSYNALNQQNAHQDLFGFERECTLDALRNGMPQGGILAIHTHGLPNVNLQPQGGKIKVAFFVGTSQAEAYQYADDWRNGEPNNQMATVGAQELQAFMPAGVFVAAVQADATWFAANWNARLTSNNAVVIWEGCNLASGAGVNSADLTTSVAAQAGGRVAFGYNTELFGDAGWNEDASVHAPNMAILFGRLSGNVDNGESRTCGYAYGKRGFVHQANFIAFAATPTGLQTMSSTTQGSWTTLNPAPIVAQTDAGHVIWGLFPTAAVKKRGAGCIVWDTYMNGSNENNASEAVQGPISGQGWFGNAVGVYGVRFDFDSLPAANCIKALAQLCTNQSGPGSYQQLRPMSGDLKKSGQDVTWPQQ